MDPALRERLAGLSRARRAEPTPLSDVVEDPGPRVSRRMPALDRILPGEELRMPSGTCWRHTRELDGWAGADRKLPDRLRRRLDDEPPADLVADRGLDLWRCLGFESGIFLDLETTGLTATPVFLAGLLKAREGTMVFTLLFARHYGEEKALLEVVAADMRDRPVAITYNGKSYDLPFLRERTGRLRVGRSEPHAVFDLLHPARRRWKHRLRDCRLKTLEAALCGRERGGDVEGRLIPDLYHRYVQDKDPRSLLRVFRHNILDLYTLVEVTEKVLSTSPEERAAKPDAKRTRGAHGRRNRVQNTKQNTPFSG